MEGGALSGERGGRRCLPLGGGVDGGGGGTDGWSGFGLLGFGEEVIWIRSNPMRNYQNVHAVFLVVTKLNGQNGHFTLRNLGE